jgi:hypothetical protein
MWKPRSIGASVDFSTALPALEGLQFVFDAIKRMGPAPGKMRDL